MTRRTALILVFTAAIASTLAAVALVRLFDASTEWLMLAYALILCGSSYSIALVFMHYESDDDRR
jgi:hypothetical protein